jgi:hypothetical protein
MFMSQRLCHLKQLPEYYCTMQSLLYKVPDPRNSAYLRKYLSSMPGKVPELVRTRLEDLDIEIEDLSLAGLQEQIVTALQKECIRKKTTKSLKKHLGFDSSVCEVFNETSSFGCSHQKKSPKKWSKSDCGCHKKVKHFPQSLKSILNLKESFTLKEDHRIIGLGNPTALFVKSLATGHLSVLCGQRPKSK